MPPPTQAAALEALIWELRRAFRELAAAADRQLVPLGLQAADRAFLEFLAREPEPVSLSALARKYTVSRQHIQQTLRRLPHPEWVKESADAADGRAVLLSLSPEGRRVWQRIHHADQTTLRQLARRLPDADIAAATRLLSDLRRELAAISPPRQAKQVRKENSR